MFIINFFTRNIKVLLVILIFILMGFCLHQCKQTTEYKERYKTAVLIAEGNLAGMKDSSIQLKMTRDQIKMLDSNLFVLIQKTDSLQKAKTQIITITKPIYLPVDFKLVNHLKYDTIKDSYGLVFNTSDSVRTFGGTSWFKLNRKDNNINILPDSTEINNFRLNFAMVISQYVDATTKYTKTKITPYHIDSTGKVTNPISEKTLKFDFRNIELLDKPYVETKPVKKTKYTLVSGWGLTVSPLGLGITSQNGVLITKYTPNISLSYCILLRKK